MLRDSQIAVEQTFSNNENCSNLLQKPHFGRLHLQLYSLGHYPRFVTLSEAEDKYRCKHQDSTFS